MTSVLMQRGYLDIETDMHRGKSIWRDPGRSWPSTTKEIDWNRSFICSLQQEPIHPPALGDSTFLRFKPLSSVVLCYNSPSDLIYHLSVISTPHISGFPLGKSNLWEDLGKNTQSTTNQKHAGICLWFILVLWPRGIKGFSLNSLGPQHNPLNCPTVASKSKSPVCKVNNIQWWEF
jgi:hypothetical protein